MTTPAQVDALVSAASSFDFFDDEGFCRVCSKLILQRLRDEQPARFEQLLAHDRACPVVALRRAVAPFVEVPA